MRLLWRIFLANAAVLTAAAVLLAISPATVSFPIGPIQAAVLVAGLGVMLAVNLVLLRRTLEPFDRLVAFTRAVDPLDPGARLDAVAPSPDVREIQRSVNEMLERLETERRESAQRLVMGQEEERRRLSRELHDEVGQLLTAALLQIDHVLARTGGDPRLEALGSARDAVAATHRVVREISRRLRPLALDDLGLVSALDALVTAFDRAGDVSFRRDVDERAPACLDDADELVVYRVAQEALTNAARHASARTVELALRSRDGDVVLTVADDGSGAGAADRAGNGIRGMRERALLVGAGLEVGPRPGGGTVVTLTLPGRDGSQHPLDEPEGGPKL